MKLFVMWGLLALSAPCVPIPATAQEAAPDVAKYWIFFADRGPVASRVHVPVTAEALDRRARRGSATPASLDYAVNPGYVAALREIGVDPIVESRWFNAITATLSLEQLRTVSEVGFVDRIRPVGRMVRAHSSHADVQTVYPMVTLAGPLALEYGPSETQLAIVNAIPPLEAGLNGSGVRLGFLDATFLGLNHPSLQHLHLPGRSMIRDFTGMQQSDSHGMNVVSVAAGYAPGELIGPAYGATVLAATTEYAPTETNAEEDFFVAGLEWLEIEGADIVSISLGYTTFDPGQMDYANADLDGDTGITTRAADRAASLGITVVAAAGNEGCSNPSNCWFYIGTPADGDSVIAVGGVTSTGMRYNRSSYGPTADGRIKPDVAAMGSQVHIATSDGEYSRSNGTSFAAPMVSGIVAQMLQANPALTPAVIADILRQTASQSERPDTILGWGIVDAAAAVDVALTVKTEEIPKGNSLAVHAYPNPATDYLFIHINARSLQRPDVRLYDILGRSVDLAGADIRHPSRDLISLETAGFSPGVYFYTIEADEMHASGSFVVVR